MKRVLTSVTIAVFALLFGGAAIAQSDSGPTDQLDCALADVPECWGPQQTFRVVSVQGMSMMNPDVFVSVFEDRIFMTADGTSIELQADFPELPEFPNRAASDGLPSSPVAVGLLPLNAALSLSRAIAPFHTITEVAPGQYTITGEGGWISVAVN